MEFFYNILLRLIFQLVKLYPFKSKKAKVWINGQKNILSTIKQTIGKTTNIAWFHCASLGEFEQGRPVIEEFKKIYQNYKIMLTFFSPSGYEIRKNYEQADYVFYLPIDLRNTVKKFIKITNPKIVFFVKYEFWFNYIREIHNRKIPLFLMSGIFRKNHIFFKWYGKFYRNLLKYFNHIFVQNEESQKLLHSININNVSISGDTRFDRVAKIALETKVLPDIEKFAQDSKVIIAGSTWDKDEEILIQYINECKRNIKYIFAPHEIKDKNIARICSWLKTPYVLYSKLDETNTLSKVLIIDNIGMLSSLYKYGDIAYIGGAFGKGLHNILEAATFGLPVIFGPNYKKFNEAVSLIKLNGAFEIKNYSNLVTIIEKLLINNSFFNNASSTCNNYILQNRGATQHILQTINNKISL